MSPCTCMFCDKFCRTIERDVFESKSMRCGAIFVDDMALPDQEINLDDYLHNNNDNNYNAQVKNLKFHPKQNNHHNNKDTNQNDQVKNLKFESKQNNLYSNIDDNNNTQVKILKLDFNVFIAVLIFTWFSLIICCCTKFRPKERCINLFIDNFSQFSKRMTTMK